MHNNIETRQIADEVDDAIVFIDDEVRICVTTIKDIDEFDRCACTNGIGNTNDISSFLPNNEDDTVDEYVSCVEDAVAVVFFDAVVLFAWAEDTVVLLACAETNGSLP